MEFLRKRLSCNLISNMQLNDLEYDNPACIITILRKKQGRTSKILAVHKKAPPDNRGALCVHYDSKLS